MLSSDLPFLTKPVMVSMVWQQRSEKDPSHHRLLPCVLKIFPKDAENTAGSSRAVFFVF
jgi:hypothetical protein